MNFLEYKGYYTKIEYSAEDKVLFGKIEGIADLVNFESESVDAIEKEFQDAVDYYLDFCKEHNTEPNKPYKGAFNVRISPDLHRQLAMYAYMNDESLNKTVERVLEGYVISMTKI